MRYLQFGLDAVKHAGSTRSAWFVLHAGPLWDKQTWVKVEIALIWVWQWQGKFVHQPTNQSRNSEGPHVCRFDQQCSSQDFSESVPYLEIAEKTRSWYWNGHRQVWKASESGCSKIMCGSGRIRRLLSMAGNPQVAKQICDFLPQSVSETISQSLHSRSLAGRLQLSGLNGEVDS